MAEDSGAPEPLEESAAHLIEAAKNAGHTVTKDQLTRWHRADLLPKPRQVHLGRAGSESWFPTGTSEQLLELLRLKARYRTLDKVRWGLWWGGYRVPTSRAREYITKLIAANDNLFGELVTDEGDLTDKAHAILDESSGNLSAGTMRRARRRIGKEDFDLFLQSLLLLGTGHTDLLKDEDLEMLEHGMALDHARNEPLVSLGGPWLVGDQRVDFENIARLTSPSFHLASLETASDEALEIAREQAKAFMKVIINVGTMVSAAGPSAFGYAAFAHDFEEIGAHPDGQAFFTVALMAIGQSEGEQGIASHIGALENSEIGVRRHRILLELREAVPELGSVITEYRLRAAMQSASADERLQADIRATRPVLGEEIDAFFAAHPEHREFLESL